MKMITVMLMVLTAWLFAVPTGQNETIDEEVIIIETRVFEMYSEKIFSDDSVVVQEEIDRVAKEMTQYIFEDICKESIRETYAVEGEPYKELIKIVKAKGKKSLDEYGQNVYIVSMENDDFLVTYIEKGNARCIICADANASIAFVDNGLDGLSTSNRDFPDMWLYKDTVVMEHASDKIMPACDLNKAAYLEYILMNITYFKERIQ